MKLHIEKTRATPKMNLNPEINTAHPGLLPLALSIVCTIGLYDLAIAQENNRTVPGTSHPASSTAAAEDKMPQSGGADCAAFSPNACGEKGAAPIPLTTANFLEIGFPSGGYPSVTDLVTFNSKLFLSTSKSPLGDFGTNVFSTSDGVSYTKVLEDVTSQGYLRIRVFDSKLWIPDGDPNGLDPSFVYTSSTGAPSSFTQASIIQAVHTFDVIKYNNQFYCSNGMGSGQGGLCKFDGSSTWNLIYQSSASIRMKYMAVLNTKLIVANRNSGSDVDCFVWSGDPQTTVPVQVNAISGATNTFRMFTSSQGKVFWSLGAAAAHVLVSQDGVTWQTATTLDGRIISDFAELNGKLYALASDGLWESTDFFTFQQIAAAPVADPTAFTPAAIGSGINPDAPASMEAFNGSLWCGSSRNGKIYKVDFTTSTPETAAAPALFEITGHSLIFQIENNSPVELRVYALDGALVKSTSYGMLSTGRHEIDLAELKQGFYMLEAIIGNEVKGIKFVRR